MLFNSIVEHFESNMKPKIQDLINESDDFNFYYNLASDVAHSIFNILTSNCIFAIIFMIVVTVLYNSYWTHVVFTKELTDIGFDHIYPGPSRLAKIRRAQRARQLGSKIPPPYPNGWFAVMNTSDLGPTGVVPVDVLGLNLCVYRGKDGVPRCVDAYCPHLGANMAVGGTVSGNCIECPFHKWKFGEDGVCVSVPGIEHAPHGVSIKTWPTVVADGSIWIWHDAEGREPQWEIQNQPELESWGYRGSLELLISAHIQQVSEISADIERLSAVNSSSASTKLGKKYSRLRNIIGYHTWSGEWWPNNDHTGVMKLTQHYKIMQMNLFLADAQVTHDGPGRIRRIHNKFPFGPILIVQSITPMGPLVQRLVHKFYSPCYNALFAKSMIKTEINVLLRDVAVWNSMRFVNAPAYVQTDKTIGTFRSWYTQFYSEKSTSFKDAVQKNPLDW